MPHRFIAEIANQTAAEAQPLRQRRGALPFEPGARVLKRIGVAFLQPDVGSARIAQQPAYLAATCFDALRAGEADERIAPEALAAHYRLEQIAVRAAGQLDVHGERRVEIGARFGDDGNAGKAKGGEPVELGLNHGPLRCGFPGTTLAAWTSASPIRAATRGDLAAPAAPATPGECDREGTLLHEANIAGILGRWEKRGGAPPLGPPASVTTGRR